MLYFEEITTSKILDRIYEKNDLKKITDADYTCGLYNDGKLLGIGSLKSDILQGIVLLEESRGEGLSTKIVTHLIQVAFQKGHRTVYLFTKPEKAEIFNSIGFRKVIDSKYASLLEYGSYGLSNYLNNLKELAFPNLPESACIVMNCNPFTKGHRYLVENALKIEKPVYVFVVEEDKSEFSFHDRFFLASENLKDLENVKIIPGGKYTISNLTFPSYFTKEENIAVAHATLDLDIFSTYIAPTLNIKYRYVGTEPFSKVTAVYNSVMKELLPSKGIIVHEIERAQVDGEIISASTVRGKINTGDIISLKDYLPQITYEYILRNKNE